VFKKETISMKLHIFWTDIKALLFSIYIVTEIISGKRKDILYVVNFRVKANIQIRIFSNFNSKISQASLIYEIKTNVNRRSTRCPI